MIIIQILIALLVILDVLPVFQVQQTVPAVEEGQEEAMYCLAVAVQVDILTITLT